MATKPKDKKPAKKVEKVAKKPAAKPVERKDKTKDAEAAAPPKPEVKRVPRKVDDTPPPPAILPTPSATFIF